MAAAAAAELLAVLLCHEAGLRAPVEGPAAAHGPLGPAYNVLRHTLPSHASTLAALPADPACVACSPAVLAAGRAWVLRVLEAEGEAELRALLALHVEPGAHAAAADAAAAAAGAGAGACALHGGAGGGAASLSAEASGEGWVNL